MSGGNPDLMDLPGFMEVSYALLAEEHQRINPLKDLLSVSQELSPPRSDVVKTTVAAQNEQSVAALKGMMMGVKKRK